MFRFVTSALGAVVTVLILAAPAAAQAAAIQRGAVSRYWHCDVRQKWECELPDGCRPIAVSPDSDWYVLDFAGKVYQRCNKFDGCGTYPMTVTEQLGTTYITLPDHPDVFLKIAALNGFVDVAALGSSAYNSLGTCRPIK
jgi:hypothetical protein